MAKKMPHKHLRRNLRAGAMRLTKKMRGDNQRNGEGKPKLTPAEKAQREADLRKARAARRRA